MIEVKVDPAPAKVFVVAGDIQGFSKAYTPGNEMKSEVNHFITRYYQLVALGVDAAGGTLVKYTGDGFMAVWPFPDNKADREQIAQIISDLTFKLSLMIWGSALGCSFGDSGALILRQGIAIEEEGLHLTYERDGHKQDDYLGRWVTLAFRLQGLAGGDKRFPYIVVDNYFRTALPWQTRKRYLKRPVKAKDLIKYFKGNTFGTENLHRYRTMTAFAVLEQNSLAEGHLEYFNVNPAAKVVLEPDCGIHMRVASWEAAFRWSCENGNSPDWLRDAHRAAHAWIECRNQQERAPRNPGID